MTSVTASVGNILVESDIEEATTKALQKWFTSYIAELSRQKNYPKGMIREPRNYTSRNSFDSEAGEKIPKVVVLVPGLLGAPTKTGQQKYRAIYSLAIAVADAGDNEELASTRSKALGALIRRIILDPGTITEFLPGVVDITWVNWSFDDVGETVKPVQLYKAVTNFFAIQIENIVTAGPGLPTPNLEAPVVHTVPDIDHVIFDVAVTTD